MPRSDSKRPGPWRWSGGREYFLENWGMRSLRQITLSHENSFTQKHFNDIGIVIEEKNDSLQRNLVVFLGKEPTSPFVRGNHSYPPLRRPALASPPYPRLTLVWTCWSARQLRSWHGACSSRNLTSGEEKIAQRTRRLLHDSSTDLEKKRDWKAISAYKFSILGSIHSL